MIDLRSEAVVTLLALAIGFAGGAHVRGKWDDAQAAKRALALEQTQKKEAERVAQVTAAIDRTAAQGAQLESNISQAIAAEVPNHVPKTVTCPAFVDAVRVLNNAAASGVSLPAPAREPDGPPAAAADDPGAVAEHAAEAERITVANLNQCRADARRQRELQEWIEGVSQQ
jgi:hypothetical protein